jgi:putative flippase GtrA
MTDNYVKEAVKTKSVGNVLKVAFQYTKFGTIGALATLVHVGIFATLIELFDLWEVQANLVAFCIAVGVSYIGHSRWTFKVEQTLKEKNRLRVNKSFIRFWLVSIMGLIINTLVVFLVSDIWQAPYYYAMALMVTVTPLFIFTTSKLWVFKHA